MLKKTLNIDLEQDYRLRIETLEEIENSFFKDIYRYAFRQVARIVKWTKDSKNEDTSDFKRESLECNNILAFVGERGTGKTSAMISVAQALKKLPKVEKVLDLSSQEIHLGYELVTIHTIDPSRFEKGQNIIEVIIAELFENFQHEIMTDKKERSESEKRNVFMAFQDVFKCLRTIIGNSEHKYDGEALEKLATLAEATKLEEYLQKLIKLYLKFIHPNNSEDKSIIIIPIDDFDLNVRHAGEMAEQIRKYLMIPNVIVLMALNMDQFGDVKTQEVIKGFETLLKESRMSESPRDVAARYILKLIPIERRINIPSIRIERNSIVLSLHDGSKIDKTGNRVINYIIERSNVDTFEEQIFEYIYKSTGLYFVSNPQEYHTFLPNTLREFRTLFSMFGMFEKCQNSSLVSNEMFQSIIELNKIKKLSNLSLFEEYFLNTWIKDYLLTPFQKMIFGSSSIPYKAWNKYFISSVIEILSKEKKYKHDWAPNINGTEMNQMPLVKEDSEFQLIIDRNNYESNVSLGDIIYFLSKLGRVYIYDMDIKRLIFSVNCWYSINFNRLELEGRNHEIRDIVNGTIINKKSSLIRDFTNDNPRIEFPINTIFNKEDNSLEYDFLKHNIFLKHQYNAAYRKVEAYVNHEIFDDTNKRFNQPTFNLFSFVCKNDDCIFPIPYNNMELWQSIIPLIDKDVKEKVNDFGLVSFLFKQVAENLKEENMRDNFFTHPIVKLFFDDHREIRYKKHDDVIPEWFNRVYNMRVSSGVESDINKVIINAKSKISYSKRRKKQYLLNDVLGIISNSKISQDRIKEFKINAHRSIMQNASMEEFKFNLNNLLDNLKDE